VEAIIIDIVGDAHSDNAGLAAAIDDNEIDSAELINRDARARPTPNIIY
jgi:hypothetical protein